MDTSLQQTKRSKWLTFNAFNFLNLNYNLWSKNSPAPTDLANTFNRNATSTCILDKSILTIDERPARAPFSIAKCPSLATLRS